MNRKRPALAAASERQRIGQEKNEQLEHLSSNFVVLQHIRHKYACPHCNSGHCQKCDGQAHIDLAAKPQQPIEKGLAGPGLLAYVVTSKLADHLPLYRLEQIFARQQVDISRSTLCGWIAAAARVVQPLYKLMCDRVRQSAVLHTDDTTVPIQHEGHCRQGRLWTYVGDEHHPYIVYDFTPTRSGQGPLGWLGKWQGFLQADAYAGYDKLYARGDVIEVACWAHARRKFFDAQESDPAGSLVDAGDDPPIVRGGERSRRPRWNPSRTRRTGIAWASTAIAVRANPGANPLVAHRAAGTSVAQKSRRPGHRLHAEPMAGVDRLHQRCSPEHGQ